MTPRAQVQARAQVPTAGAQMAKPPKPQPLVCAHGPLPTTHSTHRAATRHGHPWSYMPSNQCGSKALLTSHLWHARGGCHVLAPLPVQTGFRGEPLLNVRAGSYPAPEPGPLNVFLSLSHQGWLTWVRACRSHPPS